MSVNEIWTKVSDFLKAKTVTLTGLASFVAGVGVKQEWWDIDPADVSIGLGMVLALLVSGTVTANARLNGGKVWGGYSGKTPEDDEEQT